MDQLFNTGEPPRGRTAVPPEQGPLAARMLELAVPLHRSAFPTHRDHSELSDFERQNQLVGEVLDAAGRASEPAG